jgi:hypothetical protein
MRRHVTTAFVAGAFVCIAVTAASANPFAALFGGLFNGQAQQPVNPSYYQSTALAYAPEVNQPASRRIAREIVAFNGHYAPGTIVVSTS